MRNSFIILLLGCLHCLGTPLKAQEDFSYYDDTAFTYTDGFYLSIKDFEKNTPIEPKQVISEMNPIDPRFFKEVTSRPGFRYRQNDSIKSIDIDDLFGYCINGDPHMNMGNGDFARMATIGSICFVPVNRTPQISPSVGMGASSWGGAGMGVGINIGPPPGPSEVILLVKEGKASELSPDALAEFMSADPVLLEQYTALKKREQRKQQFQYIQMYNQRNPLR